LKPIFVLLFLGSLVALMPTSITSAAEDYSPEMRRQVPAAELTYAQRNLNSGRGRSRNPYRSSFKGSTRRLLSSVLQLIDTQYAQEVSEREILDNTLTRLSLTFLPQCMEGVESEKECPDTPDDCFLKAVETIARNCGYDKNDILRKALTILLHNLDPNSGLLDPAMLKELKISTSGKFGGVGMVVTPRDGDYVVISPFDDSPAYKAGVKAGDTIMEIDGKPLHGLPLLEVLRLVRGPAGSRMSITVKDKKTGRIGRLRLRRRVIRVPPIRQMMLSNGIGYLRIVNFQRKTADQVEKVLDRMFDYNKGGLRGLILDLRDNPGGLFTEAIAVADLFLDSGLITSVRGRSPESYSEFKAQSGGTFPEIPMVVLINKGSASASEILAGALQSSPRVLIMGEKSFGKATVQAVFSLRNGMALRLTTAHYFTPDGKDINGKGLEPDVKVESPEGLNRARIGLSNVRAVKDDPEIQKAVAYLQRANLPEESHFSSLY
jgi:carboxyl-terminal processing protease